MSCLSIVATAGNAGNTHVWSQEYGPLTALHVHVCLAFFEGVSLVMQLAATTKGELELDEMPL